MDELFRRAAKDYPLNTGSADWEKMKQALEDAPASDGKKPSNGNNRRHFLWLLMLLPLPWICNRYSGEVGSGDTARTTVSKEVAPTSAQTSGKKVEGASLGSEKDERGGTPSIDLEDNSAALDISNPKITNGINNPLLVTAEYKRKSKLLLLSNQNANEFGLLSNSKPAINKNTSEESIEKIGADKKLESFNTTMNEPVKTDAETSTSDKEATEKNQVQADSTTTKPSEAKKQKATKQKRFYVGLMGGVDATSVKRQDVKNAGYDAGLLAGYALNNKWSIEVGLMSSEKAYYSKGEYLPKAYLLPNTKLKEANGDCRMWEVPISARYHFQAGKKGGWFAAAGATSYFMNKEDYYYTYYYPATGQEVERYRSYKEKYNHLFAAAQVSAGYNRTLTKTIGVRVEPYLKLPLKKVGYYDLPLTSYGVHIGVTKKLF